MFCLWDTCTCFSTTINNIVILPRFYLTSASDYISTDVATMAHELRQLVDTANAPIFGIDMDGNVNEWNNKTAEITGFAKDDVFDKHLGE